MNPCKGCSSEMEEWRRGKYCRACIAAQARARRARDPEKYRAADRRRRATESAEERARRHQRARDRSRAKREAKYADRRCEECGKPIPLEANGAVKLCSDECRLVRRDRKNAEHYAAHKPPPKRGTDASGRRVSAAVRDAWKRGMDFAPRSCSACGAEFVPNAGSHKYCSEECYLWTRRGRQYGVSAADLRALYDGQGGACAICGDAREFSRLVVDHCHATGSVRGFLCHGCNTSLGGFDDCPDRLRVALAYLERS